MYPRIFRTIFDTYDIIDFQAGPGSLGIVLNRHSDNNKVSILMLIEGTQAWGVGLEKNDYLISTPFNQDLRENGVDESKWKDFIKDIRLHPRPMTLQFLRLKCPHSPNGRGESLTISENSLSELMNSSKLFANENNGDFLNLRNDLEASLNDTVFFSSGDLTISNNDTDICTRNIDPKLVMLSKRLVFEKEKETLRNTAHTSSLSCSPSRMPINVNKFEIAIPGRKLLKSGVLGVVIGSEKPIGLCKVQTNRVVHLMSDILMITIQDFDGDIKHMPFIVETVIELKLCKIRAGPEGISVHRVDCSEEPMINKNNSIFAPLCSRTETSKQCASSVFIPVFEIIWPGGTLDVTAANCRAKDIWLWSLMYAIGGLRAKEEQVFGWVHTIVLGSIHSAVVLRDEMAVRKIVAGCKEGDFDQTLLNKLDAEGYSPLHYACILRHHGILRLLLKSGVDVCVGDKDGLTALHWACLQLDITSLKMISENISDVEIYCKRGYSPLYLACVLGRDAYGEIDYAVLRECIYCLISKGANIDFQDEFGYFIIQHVVASWQYAVADIMFSLDVNPYIRIYLFSREVQTDSEVTNKASVIEARNAIGRTLLHVVCVGGMSHACSDGPEGLQEMKHSHFAGLQTQTDIRNDVSNRYGSVSSLTATDYDVDSETVQHSNPMQALWLIRQLLSFGINPNIKDCGECTALELAAQRYEAFGETIALVVLELVSRGARPKDAPTLTGLRVKFPHISESVNRGIELWNAKAPVCIDSLDLELYCFEEMVTCSVSSVRSVSPALLSPSSNKSSFNSLSSMANQENCCSLSPSGVANMAKSLLDFSASSSECHICTFRFNMFHREQHCRLCGVLCCDECSSKRIVLDGNHIRSCDGCYNRCIYLLHKKEAPSSARNFENYENSEIPRTLSNIQSSRLNNIDESHYCSNRKVQFGVVDVLEEEKRGDDRYMCTDSTADPDPAIIGKMLLRST